MRYDSAAGEAPEHGEQAEHVPARLEEEGGAAARLAQIFEFLDRIEDYHPSHLVAWLQSRLVTIEEVPMASAAPFQDHYDKLDLPCDADPASIRRAYRKLALATHPETSHSVNQRRPNRLRAEQGEVSVPEDAMEGLTEAHTSAA
ncbi:YSL6 [Symbiodinium natans]|uniref:YSL6 protein n=1 Tax=Symbiodinium natans TaxID=878477 RepID=A0A812I8E3_9DINO|nr:YSL6 [Symbiodinium natans]